jgi:hypothetical protein
MVDLSRALRPLIDQPPADPEPMEELQVRLRRRRRRRRVSFALASAFVVAVAVSVGVTWSDDPGRLTTSDDPGRFAATGQVPVGPTKPVIVASGEIEGQEWRLQAYEHDSRQCLDLLEGGRACFDVSTEQAVDVAVDFKISGDATGIARTSVDAVYGPVRRDVARIAIRLASGQVIDVLPVGQDAGFAVNFYVAQAPTGIPPDSEVSQVIVYDAAGTELGHLEPDCAPDLGGGPAPLAIEIRAIGPCL